MISATEKAKRFANGRRVYCSGFSYRVADCTARKKAKTFRVGGEEAREVGTRAESKESGKDSVCSILMAP
jgi:hypothetical protein